MEDHLRVGETIKTAMVIDAVFDRLPQKHLHLDQPLRFGVHHDGHLRGGVEDDVLDETKVSECREYLGGTLHGYNQWAWKSGASTVWMSLSKQRSMVTSMVQQWNAKNRSEGLRAAVWRASALQSLLT